jgi:chromosome segregation ATPase
VATVEQLQISYSSDVAQKATADKTALDGLAAGAEKAGKGIDTVDTAIKRANATFESSNRLVDGAAAAATRLESANQKLQDRIRTVNQEVATGNLTVEAAAAKILRLHKLFGIRTRPRRRNTARGWSNASPRQLPSRIN